MDVHQLAWPRLENDPQRVFSVHYVRQAIIVGIVEVASIGRNACSNVGYPRPKNGVLIAVSVMNFTYAVIGRLPISATASPISAISITGSGREIGGEGQIDRVKPEPVDAGQTHNRRALISAFRIFDQRAVERISK